MLFSLLAPSLVQVCVHARHVCDGTRHCPQQDDERLCASRCPPGCTCHGLAFTCRHQHSALFALDVFRQARYLDAAHSGASASAVRELRMLVFLGLQACGLTSLADLTFPHLLTLDASDNAVRVADAAVLAGLPQIRTLVLSRNPITCLFATPELNVREGPALSGSITDENGNTSTDTPYPFNATEVNSTATERLARRAVVPTLRWLWVAGVALPSLNASVLTAVPALRVLNVSGSGVDSVSDGALQALPALTTLDVRGCPLTHLPGQLMHGLSALRTVHADNFKLCCPQLLPEGFNPSGCHTT